MTAEDDVVINLIKRLRELVRKYGIGEGLFEGVVTESIYEIFDRQVILRVRVEDLEKKVKDLERKVWGYEQTN